MKWFGKVAGGTLGFLMGGPLGSVAGALLGHGLDTGVLSAGLRFGRVLTGDSRHVQSTFFSATYSIMGYVAKSDGRVSEREVAVTEGIIARMGLTPEMREAAIELFNQGKLDSFAPEPVIDELNSVCQQHRALKLMFVEMVLRIAYADGVPGPDEQQLLMRIRRRLGVSQASFVHIERLVGLQQQYARRRSGSDDPRYQQRGERTRTARASQASALNHAYAVLGISPKASDSDVKHAYRKLLSRHHPDKLAAQQVPDEMMRLATEKTHEIRRAYETVVKARAA